MHIPKLFPLGLHVRSFLLPAVAVWLLGAFSLQADQYTQNFDGLNDGDTDIGDGSEFDSTGVENGVEDGAFKLTDDIEGSTNSALVIPAIGASQTESFKLMFDYSLFDEEGGNPPADGFSVNVGPITIADLTSGSEEGFGVGLSVEFDTWNNAPDEAGHNIAVDGTDAVDGFNPEDPLVDDQFHFVEICYTANGEGGGLVTVRVDDKPLFEDIEVDFVPEADDNIAFAARTGGATETFKLDNLVFCAPAVERNPRIAGDCDLSFGLVDAGSTAMGTVKIENKGASENLVISEAEISGGGGAFTLNTAFPLTIEPGDSADVSVTFNAPAEAGSVEGLLELTNNDSLDRAKSRTIPVRALVIVPVTGSATYEQNFDGFPEGTMDLEDGSEMISSTDTAFVFEEALQLTDDAVGSTNAGFFTPSLGDVATGGWKASFEYLLFDADGGNPPADGFSFNWGPIDPGSSGSEEGYGAGLSVEFDTWNNGEGEAGHNVAVDGQDVPDGLLEDDPLVDGEFHAVVVCWTRVGEDNGVITVTVDGEPLFENIETPELIPDPEWIFAFAARTGGATETLLIDNLLIQAPPPATYAQNFNGFDNGDTDLEDGTTIASSNDAAGIQDNALKLTDDGIGSSRSTFHIPSLGFQQNGGFSVDFLFSLFDEEGGNPPADGFSFSFGNIAADNPDACGEEGCGTGLSIEFDTWREGDAENGFNVAVDNVDVENGFVNQPVPVDGEFHAARIEYTFEDEVGVITVLVDGEPIFEDLPVPGFIPSDEFSFVFGARTGGATETLLIDDLFISAPAAPAPPGDDPKIESIGTLNFGAVSGSATGTLTVMNVGESKDLVIESAALSGADAANYKLNTPLPITVPPGGSANLELEVTTPNRAGTVVALLTLNNNDARERARMWGVNLLTAVSVAGVPYVQDFDAFEDETTDLGDGSIIEDNNGTARVVEQALTLTEDGTGGSQASFKTPVLGDWSGGFTTTFDLAVFAELGQNPADGFSFNWGEISDVGTAGEEGYNSGLTVSFDTWNNGGEGGDTGVGLDVIVDGATVEPEDGLLREDFFENDDGFFENTFLTLDGEFRPVVIAWEPGGDGGFVSVTIGETTHIDRLALPTMVPLPGWRVAFGARTGGAHETVRIDNLNVGGGAAPSLGLRFTDVQFDSATRNCTVTWASKEGRLYIIEAGDDLENWEELQDGLEATGESTSFTEEGIPAGVKARYYRVREEQ